MQVSRGNILKTTGMLCNPKFIYKNNRYFSLSSIYFLYLLASSPNVHGEASLTLEIFGDTRTANTRHR